MPIRLRVGQPRPHDVVDAGGDVVDRTLSEGAVVEVHEALAEAGGAADVRGEDGDPLRDEAW